jgi:quercetin dioxygenase-like cupin family protein
MPLPTLSAPLSLLEACADVPELWSPRVVGQLNNQYLKLVRVHGEFPWHTHDAEDELFLILKGELTIGRAPEDGGPITLRPGEVFIVPRGIRHNTSATEETWLALIEPVSTLHTGNEQTAVTRSIGQQLGLA